MKKLLLFPALILLACSQVHTEGEKTIVQGEDTIAHADISVSKLDAVEELSKEEPKPSSKVIFKAHGSEPGWYAEFMESGMRFVYDYGKDSLWLNIDDMQNILNDQPFILNDRTLDFKLRIENTPCTNDKGDKESRTVSIIYHGKPYKGCGDLVK